MLTQTTLKEEPRERRNNLKRRKQDCSCCTMPSLIINILTLTTRTRHVVKPSVTKQEKQNPSEVYSGLWVVLVLCQQMLQSCRYCLQHLPSSQHTPHCCHLLYRSSIPSFIPAWISPHKKCCYRSPPQINPPYNSLGLSTYWFTVTMTVSHSCRCWFLCLAPCRSNGSGEAEGFYTY